MKPNRRRETFRRAPSQFGTMHLTGNDPVVVELRKKVDRLRLSTRRRLRRTLRVLDRTERLIARQDAPLMSGVNAASVARALLLQSR